MSHIPDKLYDLAMQVKKAKPWSRLWDTQIFTIRHGDGTYGYCCIMGRNGEHFSVALYHGDSGLQSYRNILSSISDSDPECMFTQDCVMLSFENKEYVNPISLDEVRDYCKRNCIKPRGANFYPTFERFEPYRYPWTVNNEKDIEYIKDALEGSLFINEILKKNHAYEIGFIESAAAGDTVPLIWRNKSGEFELGTFDLPETGREPYYTANLKDDFARARVSKLKKTQHCWGVKIFLNINAIAGEESGDDGFPTQAPSYYHILLIVDEKDETIVLTEIAHNLDYSSEFTEAFFKTIIEEGKPKELHIVDDRTKAFFSELAPLFDIKTVYQKKNDYLDDALESFYEYFGNENFDANESLDDIEEKIDEINMLLEDPKFIKQTPDDFILDMKILLKMGALSEQAEANLKKEINKRGL